MAYMARYTRIPSGYMGQLVEWPEVVTEGRTIDECRAMLRDAIQEMILVYHDLGKPIPLETDLIEPLAIESLREGGNHTIYSDGIKLIPVKRHRQFDRITANEICKQAGLEPKF